jgi:uncharacterized protein YxjI
VNYPLSLSFKVLGFAPQIYVREADGTLRMYVKQKLFKLKEAVTVFSDDSQSTPLYSIKADRVFDFNAEYGITTADGAAIGAIKRHGRRSLFSAHYDIKRGDEVVASIKEENAWIRFLEALLAQIPIVGFVAVMLLNPTYLVTRADGTLLLKVKKLPAFFEGKFEVSQHGQMTADEETRVLTSLLMMTLMERARG